MKTYMKKICVLGEPAVGKTSLIAQFVENRFDEKYLSTIGTRVSKKRIIYESEDLLPAAAPEPAQEAQTQAFLQQYQAPLPSQPYQQAPYQQYPYQQDRPAPAFQQPAQPSQPYYQQPVNPRPFPSAPQPKKPSGWERFKNFFRRKKKDVPAAEQRVQPAPARSAYYQQPPQQYPQERLPQPAYYQQVPPTAQPYQQPVQAQQVAPSPYAQPYVQQPQVAPELPEEATLNLAIWDILGQEHNVKLQQSFYRGAGGALLVCDCSRPETAQKLSQWVENLHAVESSIPLVFLGNKYDLVEGTDTVAYMEQLLAELGTAYDAPWHLTSAKTGHHVEESFKELGKKMIGD